MSLRDFQSALVRLYLEPSFRKGLFPCPPKALKGFDLSKQEIEALCGIDKGSLDSFCRGLTLKNSTRLRASFKLTANLLGERFEALYQEFSNRHSDLREWPHKLEAFSPLLFHALANDRSLPPYAAELARFEHTKAMLGYYLDREVDPRIIGTLGLKPYPSGWVEEKKKYVNFNMGFIGRYAHDVLKLARQAAGNGRRLVRKKGVSVLFYQAAKYRALQMNYLEKARGTRLC